MFTSISSNQLQSFVNKYNLKRGIEACNVCQTAEDVLKKVFPSCQNYFNVVSFDGKSLFVKVSNSVFLQELKFRENQIIGLMEDKMEGVKMERIIGKLQ